MRGENEPANPRSSIESSQLLGMFQFIDYL